MRAAAERLRSILVTRVGPNKVSKRITRASMRTNKFASKPKPDGNYKRAEYFRAYRPERTMLTTMCKSYIAENSRDEYRCIRYMYYVVMPHIAKYLWWPLDRERLVDVEHDLFNQMLSYRFKRDINREPKRVPIYWFRSPELTNVGSSQQKL